METHRIDYSAFQRAELSEFLKKGLQTTREDPELIAFLEGAFYSEEKQADNERKPEQDIDLVKGMRRSAKEGDEQQSELAGLRSIGSIDFQLQESLDGWLGSPDTKPHEGRRKGGPGTEQDGDLELQMMQDILALNELDTHPSHAEQQSVAVISTPELGARAATSQCVDGTNATKLCLNISAICKASKAAKKSNRSKIATSNKIAKRDKSLKTIFAQDPAAKRAYAAEATRKYREKRKLEKDWLITRNRWLEEEQGMFQKRIGSLKGEISRLEGVMKGQNQDEYAWMLLEHQVLQREAKRQRTLLQTIKNVISYSHASVFSNTGVPWKCCLDEDSTEEYCGQKQKKTDAMVSLPELGVQSAVSNILGVCYLSVENAKKTWFDINLTANPIFKTALKQSHYFSELERVTTTGELLPKGCSVKTATKESVRLDFHGLWLSKETLTTALEKFISRKDEFSFFNFVKEYYQKRSGVKCRFTELNSMLSKLCLVSSDCGLETCERDAGAVEEEARSQGGPLKADNQSWQHGASDKKVIINRVKAEESFSGDGDAKETFWVTSLGEEMMNTAGFLAGGQTTTSQETHFSKGYLVSNSLAVTWVKRNKSRCGSPNMMVDSSFHCGLIVQDFAYNQKRSISTTEACSTAAEKRCNLTVTASLSGIRRLLSFLEEVTEPCEGFSNPDTQEEATRVQVKENNNYAMLVAWIINGLTKSLEEMEHPRSDPNSSEMKIAATPCECL